jgi:hypothetical protein
MTEEQLEKTKELQSKIYRLKYTIARIENAHVVTLTPAILENYSLTDDAEQNDNDQVALFQEIKALALTRHQQWLAQLEEEFARL